MRVLLFGGTGQLGSQIRARWLGDEIIAPARAEAPIEDRAAVERVLKEHAPDAVVNCAAFNDVPRAERHPDEAFLVNSTAVGQLAKICAKQGCSFITFSTDYVFDGSLGRPYRETDAPNPLNTYGKSKLAGETLVLTGTSPAYVIRTCGVYGTGVSTSKGHTFIHRVIERARSGEHLRIVDDQTISPTYAGDLAVAVRSLINVCAPYGLYHAANEGAVTWYQLACGTLRQAGITAEIEPISSADFSAGVRRPAFSALENEKLHAIGLTMPGWEEGVAAFLQAAR